MVSKAKLLNITRTKIKGGLLPCIYCGGVVPGTQVDHVPPRAVFKGRYRPDGLIFPACGACNQGSRDVDQMAAWLSRVYPPGATPMSEISKLNDALVNNYPEVASSLIFSGGGASHVVVQFDQYIVRTLELFATKIGLALHYEFANRLVPNGGSVSAHFFTNFHALTKAIPRDLFRLFQKPETLWQGRKHVGDQFEYASAGIDDRSETVHMATFRQSFMVVAFVKEHGAFPDPEAPTYKPGCLQRGYPFGLPRLTEAELNVRFSRMRG